MSQLFDSWVDPYASWFETPIGQVIKEVELDLLLAHLSPKAGESILDAGCGSGLFSPPIVESGATLTGLDISRPMLQAAKRRLPQQQFCVADMLALPFDDNHFDKSVSVTARSLSYCALPAQAEPLSSPHSINSALGPHADALRQPPILAHCSTRATFAAQMTYWR
ncbi:MAG: class I SAM-dependent methyltransferase [Pseudomonadales bacterium]